MHEKSLVLLSMRSPRSALRRFAVQQFALSSSRYQITDAHALEWPQSCIRRSCLGKYAAHRNPSQPCGYRLSLRSGGHAR
ncbi:Uncharacterised protein [Vibrio cholerae]|nr:Uncharacterised protein [Vibrio cholerae]CSI53778.1 Uncharacterised protein [Vibrio cholerae]